MNKARNVARIRVTTMTRFRRSPNSKRPQSTLTVSFRRLPSEVRPVERIRPPAHVFVIPEYSYPPKDGATTTTRVRRPQLSLNHARRRVEQIIHLPANMHAMTVHTRINILSTAPKYVETSWSRKHDDTQTQYI